MAYKYNPTNKRNTDRELNELIVKRHSEGLPNHIIAKRLGVSHSKVGKAIKNFKLQSA